MRRAAQRTFCMLIRSKFTNGPPGSDCSDAVPRRTNRPDVVTGRVIAVPSRLLVHPCQDFRGAPSAGVKGAAAEQTLMSWHDQDSCQCPRVSGPSPGEQSRKGVGRPSTLDALREMGHPRCWSLGEGTRCPGGQSAPLSYHPARARRVPPLQGRHRQSSFC